MDLKTELSVLIRARETFLCIHTTDEEKTTEIVKSVANERIGNMGSKQLYCWSITKGLYQYGKAVIDEDLQEMMSSLQDPMSALEYFRELTDDRKESMPAIMVMYDMIPILSQGIVPLNRRIKELSRELIKTRKTVVFVESGGELPENIRDAVTLIEEPYPTKEELSEVVRRAYDTNSSFVSIIGNRPKEQVISEISAAAAGLKLSDLESVIRQSMVRKKFELEQIINLKKEVIRKSGVLEYFDTHDLSLDDIGGLDLLKNRITLLPRRFSEEARQFGLEKPKGIITIGPPGTGKSFSAKITAATLGVPLIRISMSQIASKWYGESTSNLRRALNVIVAIAPCVVLFDEIEKILSVGTGGEAHEETMRMMGELLTFIEECTAPVFFIGTCNDYRSLKPELMQRFEHLFFVDLPNQNERMDIFRIHIQKTGRNPDDFSLSRIAAESDGFVGREIRVLVKEALGSAFDQGRDVTTDDFLIAARSTVPTSKQGEIEAQIKRMRDWAKTNCMPASSRLAPVVSADEQKNEQNEIFVEE